VNRDERIYAALIRVLPCAFRREFGREMQLVVRARRAQDSGTSLSFWAWALTDLARAAFRERMAAMKDSHVGRQILGAALLLIPIAFLISQAPVYELNVPGLTNPFDTFYNRPGLVWLGYAMDALIFLGPLVAFALTAPLFLRQSVHWQPEEGVLVAVSLTWPGLITAALMLIGLTLGAMFAAYILAENWQCLLGLAASC
jgi:hypothetical protein